MQSSEFGGTKLNVVHIISGLGQGGAETVLHRLLTAPGQTDHHCVISMGDEGLFGPRLREAGITLYTLNMQGVKGMAAGLLRMHRLLRELNPDVVQTWMYHADLIGGIVARMAGIRAVSWGIRNSGADLGLSSRSARMCLWACARVSGLVPGVIVACAENARVRHRQWGYRDDRMLVIPNGYDLSRWRPDPDARTVMRQQLGVEDGTPVIGNVARWNPLKDYENLIAAFAIALRRYPQLRGVLIGEGLVDTNADLTSMLDRYGVREQFKLLGRRDDVPALMNAFDVHVLASRAEGFPNVVAEAMATDVLCVATDVGDARLMVGDAGWVVAARDAKALSQGIEQAVAVLGTSEHRQRAERGRTRVENLFSLDAMVSAYQVVWRRLAQDYPAGRGVAGSGQQAASGMSGVAGAAGARDASRTPNTTSTASASNASNPSSAWDASGTSSASAVPPQQRIKRLLIVVNNPLFFLSHRLQLALDAKQAGYDVHIATMDGPAVADVVSHGLVHHVIPMSRSGKNPLEEAHTLYALWGLFRRLRPDVVHAVTIKPVLYGGIAARLAGVKAYVAAISGLGFVFTRQKQGFDFLRVAAIGLYRLALGHPNSRVIFQNTNDRDVLQRAHVVRAGQAVMIRGSGVSLDAFPALPEPEGPIVAIMVARLLRDKGVMEFVEAARIASRRSDVAGGRGLRWVLVGAPDPGNPASVSAHDVEQWRQEGVVECLGERSDIASLYADAHIAVLPSYREGLPKSLVEAAACGRAVVTTDVPGCRDAIEPGASGLLVPVRDANSLADAVLRLANDNALRQQMGAEGRRLAEREFDIDQIISAHLAIYDALTNRPA